MSNGVHRQPALLLRCIVTIELGGPGVPEFVTGQGYDNSGQQQGERQHLSLE